MTNKELFLTEYTKRLIDSINKKPDQYAYSAERAPEIAVKMVAGLAQGTANKDSNAIRGACKTLNVKFTYAAIKQYLNS